VPEKVCFGAEATSQGHAGQGERLAEGATVRPEPGMYVHTLSYRTQRELEFDKLASWQGWEVGMGVGRHFLLVSFPIIILATVLRSQRMNLRNGPFFTLAVADPCPNGTKGATYTSMYVWYVLYVPLSLR
jgi:hypothetical protein